MATRTLGGRYKLIKVLGKGAMGTVWNAHDQNLDRPVAIKVISNLAEAPEASARLRREARSAARLTSPHIATVYDHGHDSVEDTDYVVMELVPGKTLRQVVAENGPQQPCVVARWGVQICQALTEAHGRGVWHRDLKPHNVMLTPNGTVKLVDFGIAAYAEAADYTRITASGAVIGTPAYLSPEQAQGQLVDHRSDLYSLGCTLYELLTGQTPFSGTTFKVLLDHLNTSPAPPSEHQPDLEPWDGLVLSLLAKNPETRPTNAASVAQRLEALTRAPSRAPRSAAREVPPLATPTEVKQVRTESKKVRGIPAGHQTGFVKWWNPEKGYGFLVPDNGGPDVFVHYSVIQLDGFRTLEDGQRVAFAITQMAKGPGAEHVIPLS
ncbi:protein kinase [Streptomyces sp. Tu102]|uniref:protein kinase domain-containing protein n=1 Tax=Streptomyces sp. Tu102 TaxID=2838019 RepID=UPI001BDD01EC|nr:protein kinase [Streptomyces sp. Tu102]MBT1092528.1 protein kinase [Streptomyces sp. Tu102]